MNLSKPMLLAVLGTLLVAACRNGSTGKSDIYSSASRYPKFARACIRKVEERRHYDMSGPATTFVGATPSSAPFVAITEPQGSLTDQEGHNRGGNTFFAHPLSSLYITTPDYTVELTSVVPFRSLRSTKVIVGDKGLITLDLDLMDVVIGKSESGDWKALSVHCKFPKIKVSDEELQSDFLRLEKMGWGDKKFPPEHAQLHDRYRKRLLSYVAARHVKPSQRDIYESGETSDTGYLMDLLFDLIEHGIEPTFEG